MNHSSVLSFFQTVLSAGSKNLFSDALLLKVMGELAVKLPLNFAATVSRLSTAVPHAEGQMPPAVVTEASHICQRSYNLLFELVVQNIKQMRDADDFLPIWTRFVTVLATNAHAARAGAPRSQQWWHDEMCDALEALLRLLRLPVMAPTAGSVKASTAPVEADKNAVVPAPAASSGFFGWFVAPLIAATDGPDVTGGIKHPDSVHNGSASTQELPLEPSDGFLLRLSWSHICSAYPTFPGSLRLRDPRLHARISTALQLPEIYFQKNSSLQKERALRENANERYEGSPPYAERSPAPGTTHGMDVPVAVSPLIAAAVASPPASGLISASPEVAAAGHAALHIAQSPPNLPFPTSIRSPASSSNPAVIPETAGERVVENYSTDNDAPIVAKQASPVERPTPPAEFIVEAPSTNSQEKDAENEANRADRTITPVGDESRDELMMSPEFDTISLISATSLLSPPFTNTPAKRPESVYDTPLAEGKSALEFPTPAETPPVEPSHTPQTESAMKQAMPYVKNLTPIFASAEADRHQQDRAAELATSESKHVARRLEMGAASTPVTKAPAAPGDSPWQTYPTDTPPVHKNPLVRATAAPTRPEQTKPIAPRSAAKGSRVQIV